MATFLSSTTVLVRKTPFTSQHFIVRRSSLHADGFSPSSSSFENVSFGIFFLSDITVNRALVQTAHEWLKSVVLVSHQPMHTA
jgi:hypothetical protein